MEKHGTYLEEYKKSHQHPVNKMCHTLGVPMVVISIPLVFWQWKLALLLFVVGWIFQFVGHAVEGKKPSFFSNPLHLLTGVRWWWERATQKFKNT